MFEKLFSKSKSEEEKPVEYFTFRQDLIDKPLDSLSQEELVKLRNDLAEQYQKGINTEQIAAVDKKIADINILTGSDAKPKEVEIPSWDPKNEKSQEGHERDELLNKELAIEEKPKEEISEEERMEKLNAALAPEPEEKPIETLSEEEKMKRLNEDLTFEPAGNAPSEKKSEETKEAENAPGLKDQAVLEVGKENPEDKDWWEKHEVKVEAEEKEEEDGVKEEEKMNAELEELLGTNLDDKTESELQEIKKKAGSYFLPGISDDEAGKLGEMIEELDMLIKEKEAPQESEENEAEAKNKPSVAVVKSKELEKEEGAPITAEPIPLEDLKPEIKEAEIEKDQKEIEAEVEKMTLEEKEKVGAAFRNIGFKAKEWSHAKIASILAKASKNSDEDSAIGRILISSKKKFEEYADKDRERAKSAYDKEGHYAARNSASLVTTALRFGRIITDVTGRTAAAPLRYFMMAGKAAGATADILQNARFSNKELIERNRFEKEDGGWDEDLGYNEAWDLYENALNKKLEKNKAENSESELLEEKNVLSAEDLKQAYFENMPADLVKRIEREPKEALNFVQRLVKWDLGTALGMLKSDLEKIEKDENLNDKEKEEKKAILLRKQERNLNDYDRMLSQYGTVDGLAMLGRYAKTASKTVVYATTIQTAGMVLENLWNNASEMISHFDFIYHAPTESDTTALRGGSSERVRQIISGHDSSAIDTAHAHADTIAPDTAHVGVAHDSIPSDTTPHIETAHDSLGTDTTAHAEATPDSVAPSTAEGHIPAEINGLEGGHIPTPENVEIIHKGSSVIGTMENMVREGKITESQYLAALHNPESVSLVHGVPTHVSHISLTHEGNGIRFIAGENGGAPRFEVIEADGTPLGNDQDLANAYEKLGKKPPEWLEKALHGGTAAGHDTAIPDHAGTPDIGHAEVPAHDVSGIADKTPDYVGHYNEAGDYNAALGEHGYEANTEAHITTPSVEHAAPTGEMNLENIPTPDAISQSHDMVADIYYEFSIHPLTDQENIVRNLGPVHDDLDRMLASGQEFSNRSEMVDTRDMIETMQRAMLETERAFRDKIYSFGFRKPGEYERIFGQNRISVKALIENAKASHDDKLERLAKFIIKQRPSDKESKLDVTTFLKSRFR